MEASGLAPGAVDAVEQCLKALTTATKFDVAELWVNTASNFVLYHVHNDEENPIEHQTDDVSYARFLAKKALKSQDNFFWGSNPKESLTQSAPYRTAFAMRLPVDNVSTDLYILCYSHAYIVYAQSKLDFMYWLAHAVSVAVFSTSLYKYDESTVSGMVKSSKHSAPVEDLYSSAHGGPDVDSSKTDSTNLIAPLISSGSLEGSSTPAGTDDVFAFKPQFRFGTSNKGPAPDSQNSTTSSRTMSFKQHSSNSVSHIIRETSPLGAEVDDMSSVPPSTTEIMGRSSVHIPDSRRHSYAHPLAGAHAPSPFIVDAGALDDTSTLDPEATFAAMAQLENYESHPCGLFTAGSDHGDVVEMQRSRRTSMGDAFLYPVEVLAIRREVDREVDLEDLEHLEFLTEGR